MNDSNCAANIRYINTNDSKNASKNDVYARCNSFDEPCTPEEYSGGKFRSFTNPSSFAKASASDAFGGRLDESVTTRWRLRRLIDPGLRASTFITRLSSSTGMLGFAPGVATSVPDV